MPIGQLNTITHAETCGLINPCPPQSDRCISPRAEPVVMLFEGQFAMHNVRERIVQIDVFGCRDIEVLTDQFRRVKVDSDTLNIPPTVDESQLKAYFDHVSVVATQVLNGDEYILRAHARGVGGGATPSKASGLNESQKPRKFDIEALPDAVQQRFKEYKEKNSGNLNSYLEYLVENGNTYELKFFLTAGADPDSLTSKNSFFPRCPLILHALYNQRRVQIDVIRLLIKAGANVNVEYQKIPMVFWIIRDVRLFYIQIDRLKERKADYSASLNLLGQAVEGLNLLLQNGVDPNSKLSQDMDMPNTAEKLKAGNLFFHLSEYGGSLQAIIKAGLKLTTQGEIDTMRRAGDKFDDGYELALTCWKCAAEHGDAESQYKVGRWYLRCMTTEPNPAQALPWLQKAADQHHTRAQLALSTLYTVDTRVSKNDTEKARWLQSEAEKGHVIAQIQLALSYAGGKGVPKSDAECARWLGRAATSEDPNALALLGLVYYCGDIVPCDYAKAGPLLHKAAEKNSPLGQFELAQWYSQGKAVPVDLKRAFQLLEKAAAQDDEGAQLLIGLYYLSGKGVAANLQIGLDWLRKAANNDSTDAQIYLGEFYEEGAYKEVREAAKWYQKAIVRLQQGAEKGSCEKQYYLGHCYEKGYGVPKNEAEAERLFKSAAAGESVLVNVKLADRYPKCRERLRNDLEQIAPFFETSDNPTHQAFLGLCYAFGRGVPQNTSKADELLQKSAEKNSVCGQIFLGDWYYNSDATPQGYQQAIHWYQKASLQGDAEAHYKLGVCYQKGHGVARNPQEAARLFRLAADKGQMDAQYELGLAFLEGAGVEKNSEEAAGWIMRAAFQGHEQAMRFPDIVDDLVAQHSKQKP